MRAVTPADLTLIVAAGGMSTRMGEDKRFLPMADGETLLSRTLRRGRAAGFRAIVLAAEGERRELTELSAAYGAHLVTDERPQQGPAAAIAAGLAAATASSASFCVTSRCTNCRLRWMQDSSST